tara:strand:+ start:455 stop:1063 length:609 start_codon:yes stop_codon:yes gene_type:complete
MRLIELTEDGLPVFSPEARMIVEFNRILMRDGSKEGDKNGRKKEIATKELAFVHFWCIFDSRYSMYDSDEQKMERIRDDVGLDSEWRPDELIEAAIYKYRDLIRTKSSEAVEIADQLITKLKTFYKDIDFLSQENKTKAGSLIIKPKDVEDHIKGLPDLIEKKQKAEQMVRKEFEELSNKKVNKEIGMFEGKSFKVDYTKPI